MRVVYIAHPISGDIPGNLERIRAIVRQLNLERSDIVPFAPYWLDCHALDDNNPDERQRGIKNDIALLKAGFIHELWLYGDRVSKGMEAEVWIAMEKGIPVVGKTPETHAWLVEQRGYIGPYVKHMDLVLHLYRQRQFSAETFGPGLRTGGITNHIRKELEEIANAPTDLMEWVDVILLALDGAWRTGATPHQIAGAILEKQDRNERRTWPDWRTLSQDDPIEHDRSNEQTS